MNKIKIKTLVGLVIDQKKVKPGSEIEIDLKLANELIHRNHAVAVLDEKKEEVVAPQEDKKPKK